MALDPLLSQKFSLNLHLPHLLHPPKLGETRLSFGRRCTFGISFLHRFCTFCTRRDRLRDEPDARSADENPFGEEQLGW